MNTLVINEKTHVASSGRKYVEFQPILKTDILCHGSLSFACWHEWEDEPEKHQRTRMAALQNAKNVLAIIAKEVDVIPYIPIAKVEVGDSPPPLSETGGRVLV